MRLPYDAAASAGRQFIALAREFAAAILLTVEEGWAVAVRASSVNAGAREIEITERLRDGMREALRSGKFEWAQSINMIVLPGTESRSRPEQVAPDGRTDIPILFLEIFLRFDEHNPHAIIECKRVAGNDSNLCREYVVEGIDRFRKGKYAGNHSTGFMIGYVIASDVTTATTGINGYLTRKSRDDENLESSSILNEPWTRQSRHPRTRASTIELHHAFLTFGKQPPDRCI